MKNKMMKTALLASVVAILSACDKDSKPVIQATNNVPTVNNNQASNKPATNGSQTSNPSANSGSQANNQSPNTHNQTGNKPATNGSQTSNTPANSGSQANNQSPNTHNQTGNKPATNGSQTSSTPANSGSQANNSLPSTNNQTGNKPATNGSQTSNTPANSGSQANNSSPSTNNQTGNKPATNGSQTSNTPTNSGSQANNSSPSTNNQTGNKPATNSLTLNENPHLFANENKFLVKPPEAKWQPEIDKAVAFTNQLRREKGLQDLKVDPRLAAHAQRRAEELAGRYSHTRPNGESYATGAVYIGENITPGYPSAEKTVMDQWKNSKGHYDNMTNAKYTKIGLGMVAVPGTEWTYYWVQIFGFDNSTSDYEFDTSTQAKQNRLSDVTVDVGRSLPAVKWLHVDGVGIQLHHVTGNGSWHDFKGGAYNGMANGYADTRFGVIRKDSDAYKVFYRGVNTDFKDMPQTGSANYTGKAVITDGKTLNTNLDAQFKADFGDKKLTGVLSEKGNRVVDINAHIRGSTFHSPQNAPVETQGSFFGKTANELGGVFHENATGKFGAFGAKR